MNVYRESPITLAILKLFNELEDWISINHANMPHGAVKAFIFGGCAFHIHTNARGSNDIDAEIQAIQQLQKEDILLFLENNDVEYMDDNNLETNLEFDSGFNTSLASIDPDYNERVIPLIADCIEGLEVINMSDIKFYKDILPGMSELEFFTKADCIYYIYNAENLLSKEEEETVRNLYSNEV